MLSMASRLFLFSLTIFFTLQCCLSIRFTPGHSVSKVQGGKSEIPSMGSSKLGPKFVIIDTDAGLDDAWAIFLSLQAHQNPDIPFTIVGITATAGNARVGNVTENAARVLDVMEEQNIPIYRGADAALVHPLREDEMNYFGQDGFGDANLPPFDYTVESSHASNGILELAQKYFEQGQKVTILALGPLTNVAMAYRLNPTVMKEMVEEIYFLGGNHMGIGNMDVAAEFNVYADVEAAHIVLENFYPVPIYVVPWETCMDAIFDLSFRTEILGIMETKEMALLNKIEATFLSEHTDGWLPSDSLAAAMVIDNLVSTQSETHWAGIEVDGTLTRGMMVVDKAAILGNVPNVQITTTVDIELYKKMLIWAAGGPLYTN